MKFIPSIPMHCLNFLPIVLVPSALTVAVCFTHVSAGGMNRRRYSQQPL